MGTRFLTAEEVGAYLLLLCEQWDKGYLENDPKTLQTIARVPVENLDRVLKKFQRRGKKLINHRLEQEKFKLAEYINKQTINGSKGGRPKKPVGSSGLTQPEPKKTSSTSTSTSTSPSTSSSTSTSDIDISMCDPGSEESFKPPTLEEVKQFFKEKGYTADAAQKAYDYYATAQWQDSNGSPVRFWKQKIIAAWFKDEYKIPVKRFDEPQSFMKQL
jgi:uncharacterized protein YdaU (DUF1376 family)